jgi:serine protease Do
MYDPLKTKVRVAVITAAAFLTGLGVVSGLGWTHNSFDFPTNVEQPQVSTAAVRPALDLSEAFVNVSDVVTPAVVRIETRRPAQAAGRGGRGQQQIDPDIFRRFFGPDAVPPENFQPQPQLSGGSGFMVTEDGYILTNDHVVNGADQVLVYLQDKRYFTARIVGTDPLTDVAVVKIDVNEKLPHLSFGDADKVRVGEWVLAIGNPGFAGGQPLDYTVTAGIVSARGRGLQLLARDMGETGRYAIEDYIQTDAAINPGNSGGPLVDIRGQVIGINSAIASATGYYQGYGFAIPINMARRVMEDLVEFGHVKRAMMGVSIQPVSPEDAQLYGLPSVSGVLVQEITGEPAQRAGIKSGDVIVAIEGQPVSYAGQLQQRVAQFHPGDQIKVTLYRNKRPMDINVRLTEAPINTEAPRVAERNAVAEERLGIQVEPLTQENMGECGFQQAGGVVVSNVQPGSNAQRRGLGPCLKILSINGQSVNNTDQVRETLTKASSGDVVIFVVATPDQGADGSAGAGQQRIVNVRMP